jgi:hypothetical protein
VCHQQARRRHQQPVVYHHGGPQQQQQQQQEEEDEFSRRLDELMCAFGRSPEEVVDVLLMKGAFASGQPPEHCSAAGNLH